MATIMLFLMPLFAEEKADKLEYLIKVVPLGISFDFMLEVYLLFIFLLIKP